MMIVVKKSDLSANALRLDPGTYIHLKELGHLLLRQTHIPDFRS
jgi:hypothetical protein